MAIIRYLGRILKDAQNTLKSLFFYLHPRSARILLKLERTHSCMS